MRPASGGTGALQPGGAAARGLQSVRMTVTVESTSAHHETRRPSRRRLLALIALLLFLGSLLAVSGTSHQYGMTYDEVIYASLGAATADWFARLGRSITQGDFRTPFIREVLDEGWASDKDHGPPLVKASSGLSQRWLAPAIGFWAAFRLPSAVLFALCVAGLFLWCASLWGIAPGLFAALAFALMPRVFAHAHYAALDTGVAALSLLTAAAFFRSARTDSWRWAVATGILFGLALLTKFNAWFLPPVLFLWSLLFMRRALLKNLIAIAVIGPVVFLAGWPWLWHDPFGRLWDNLTFYRTHYAVDVHYLGQTYHYAPWHYPFVLTGVTLPALTLAFVGVGLIAAVVLTALRRAPEASLLAIAALAPLCISALPGVPKYNGVRLFLSAFPFLAALAGLGFAQILAGVAWIAQRLRPAVNPASPRRWAAAALGAVVLLPAAVGVITTHPYQLAYYNALAGGPLGATDRGFETIYWGGVLRDALPYLNSRQGDGELAFVTPKGVTSLLVFYQRAGLLRPDLRFTTPRDTPEETDAELRACDFVIFQCAQSEFDTVSWPLYRDGVSSFARDLEGAALLLVFEGDDARRALAREGRAP